MNNYLKVLFAALLFACVFTREKICNHLGFGQASHHEATTSERPAKPVIKQDKTEDKDSFINETIYNWNDYQMDWVSTEEKPEVKVQFINHPATASLSSSTIEIEWKTLIDIQYRLQYFSEIEMEMYSPVFSEAVEALDGKEVIIKGFVIPFDDDEGLVSLSFNPYASCFFCGKASPASVMSLYLKDKASRYKIDDFKKFRGILQLNYNDPNEFYYILKDAKEE